MCIHYFLAFFQFDAAGWALKEYNPNGKQSAVGSEQNGTGEAQKGSSAPQSGFVWDEKSGYYYDAASGFYYDGNSGSGSFFDVVLRYLG